MFEMRHKWTKINQEKSSLNFRRFFYRNIPLEIRTTFPKETFPAISKHFLLALKHESKTNIESHIPLSNWF